MLINDRNVMCEYLINKWKKNNPEWITKGYGAFCNSDITEFHKSLPGYESTPVVSLNGLAKKVGLKNIYVKDESQRFGVNAFKPLGASYAIYSFLKKQWKERFGAELTVEQFLDPAVFEKLGSYTFCGATDGNHGRAVAWTANRLKQKAVIYMPSNTAISRVKNIESEGATAVLIDGTFDECVAKCDEDAKKNNWQVIADTAYPGYMEIPNYIMAGYSTIFQELNDVINFTDHTDVDVVILQAGVGGLTAAGTWYYKSKYKDKCPKIVCLEPILADSFMESAKYGEARESKNNYQSIMAGLNCGVSLLALPVILDACDIFVTISEKYPELAMRQYYYTEGDDRKITSGESGASGMAGLIALLNDASLAKAKEFLNLGKETSVLLINTEGDTDPENYKKIVFDNA